LAGQGRRPLFDGLGRLVGVFGWSVGTRDIAAPEPPCAL
jgi:hypothetical protein